MAKLVLFFCMISLHSFSAEYDELFVGTDSNSRYVIPYFNFVEGSRFQRWRKEVYSFDSPSLLFIDLNNWILV